MIGERNHSHPTVHVPPWTTIVDDPTVDASFPFPFTGNADDYSPFDDLTALQRYLPSNDVDLDSDDSGRESDLPSDAYSCDHFRMFEFKVRKCTRARSHDWTECPYAHPGEKARRRDPRKFHYSGTACPDFRKGNCRKGDACEFAHGVFECWLHPARYRTQPCKDGRNCRRRVCFFAHSPDQLRVLSPRAPGSGSADSYDGSSSLESPPMSPMTARSLGSGSVNEMVLSLRQLQLNKVKSMPSSWGPQMGSRFGSPTLSITRPVFCSLPSTPTSTTSRSVRSLDLWDKIGLEEEPVMERVESGRDLRAKMFEKLSRENPLDGAKSGSEPISAGPDLGWVSKLVT
ncbi:unnamed protein product [Thlaspi arvense]|uniref:C3H1-type domain-containing protein n=1 Tax=Thlaspi arvense TaxID=13288 RepID=A0AAU9S2H1_THLAR|nr:unnamed protein product [Thlaspi arvense]